MSNLILSTDGYKFSQFLQLPEGAEYQFSYIESRGGKWDKVVFFGLQMFLLKDFSKPITQEDIDEAEEVVTAYGAPFNRAGWQYILDVHGGYLPLEIKAVPEGTVVDGKNVIVTIKNTDPKCAWLVSYGETMILRAIWYPCTVATQSREIKLILKEFAEATSDNTNVDFSLHDFGARGVSSKESAEIGGLAHMVNFSGSDTVEALAVARKYYNAPIAAAFGIPASEHSSITCWGGEAGEIEAFRNMIVQFGGPDKIYACVSDSYNIYEAIRKWKSLEPLILEKGGRLVIRPDSGDPADIIAGTSTVYGGYWSDEGMGVIELALTLFGCKVNEKGYRVLPDHIRFIQGDGVNADSIRAILTRLEQKGISSENIVFGMGGALLQGVNRDTLKFAMKSSALRVNGMWRDVFKDPSTDPGKRSKKGLLGLVRDEDGSFRTVQVNDQGEYMGWTDKTPDMVLQAVFRNGAVMNRSTLDEVRARASV